MFDFYSHTVAKHRLLSVRYAVIFATLFFVFLSVHMSFAAAPVGTLSATSLTVQVAGGATAINTITITDDATPQITSTSDVFIRIPTTINAYWDTSDTTATLGGTMGGTATTSPTVSYPDSDLRTVKVDVLEDYEASGTLTIAGLSVIGYSNATDSANLTWSVDGGLATGTATAAIEVGAAANSSGSVSLADSSTNSDVNVTINFTTATSTPADGIVQVVFPSGFDASVVQSATCSTMDGSFAASAVDSTTVNVTRSGGTAQDAAAEICTINNIRTPISTGTSGTFSILTLTSASAQIGTESSITGVDITAGSARDVTPPGAVINPTVTDVGDGTSLDLAWVNPTDADFSTVRIYRRTVGGTDMRIASTSAESYRDTGLQEGVTYYYRFQPVDALGNERVTSQELFGTPTVTSVEEEPQPVNPPDPTQTPPPVAIPPLAQVTPPPGVYFGDLIKGESSSSVYFYSARGYRHAFPNEKVFASWYDNFDTVIELPDDILATIPLGRNARVRPGTFLIKIVSDTRVYAVEPNGVLRWIDSEERARALFGPQWAARVIDVDVTLFVDYELGDPIISTEHPAGTVLQLEDGVYYVERVGASTVMRLISDPALKENRLLTRFYVAPGQSTAYPPDTAILKERPDLISVVK